MATLSLCMIVKNEENNLARCLNLCKNLFDEIIIVDTGSTDNTKNIAKKYTAKIFDLAWQNDFSIARNYSFSKATSEYIMWLDADDVISKTALKKLIELKKSLTQDVYMLKYNIAFCNNKPTFSYYRERILKNCPLAIWQGVVHECITPFGKVQRLNIAINHKKANSNNSSRNLKIYQELIKTKELSPREQYYYGRELYDHRKYKKCIRVLNKFVKSNLGWLENVIDALFLIANCYQFLGDDKKQFETLLNTFKYDTPRANICCKMGDYFLNNKLYDTAIYWYKIATTCPDITYKGGFVEPIYYNYYPYLQMCYCYYCKNDNQTAEKYNNKAKKYFKSEQVLHNEKYFNNLKNK